MDIEKVPQDNISTFSNNAKAMYATDESGEYSVVRSSGWIVEEAVTKQALNEFDRLAMIAYELVERGEKSPLYYHMFAQRMDTATLAQSMGWFQWRVKRHFNPTVFSKLSEKVMKQYSEALGVSTCALSSLPDISTKPSNDTE